MKESVLLLIIHNQLYTYKQDHVPLCHFRSKLVVIKATSDDECDQYSCPVPPNKYCFVTGRTFTTFDGVEYKYDICDHVIAQDRINKEWQIRGNHFSLLLKYSFTTQPFKLHFCLNTNDVLLEKLFIRQTIF